MSVQLRENSFTYIYMLISFEGRTGLSLKTKSSVWSVLYGTVALLRHYPSLMITAHYFLKHLLGEGKTSGTP